MRIAAGVLLIILAIANLCSGVLWGFLGGVSSGAGGVMDQVVAKAKEQNKDISDMQVDARVEELKAKSGMFMVYGFGQIALAIFEVVAAIFCFTSKNPMIITVAGIAEIGMSILAIFAIGFGLGVWIGLGVLTGILAIIAATQLKSTPPTMAAMQ
ncbi:MAG: hypothetical protein MPJ50_02580 [Pirellulales bacterium]|nr:hypothetical protein [Pirellulales bacterium]